MPTVTAESAILKMYQRWPIIPMSIKSTTPAYVELGIYIRIRSIKLPIAPPKINERDNFSISANCLELYNSNAKYEAIPTEIIVTKSFNFPIECQKLFPDFQRS